MERIEIKNCRILLLLLVWACGTFGALVFAQQSAQSPAYRQAAGIHIGSTGIGAQYFHPLGTQFGLRAGLSFMPFSTSIKGTYSGRKTPSDIKAHANHASLLFGYAPFSGRGGFFNSFGFELGGAYFFKLDGDFETRLSDPYKHGDILVDPERVGLIYADVKWKKTVSPYLGMGWSNIHLTDKLSGHLNLGCYYLSKPRVTLEATGLLKENVINQEQVQHNIRNYRYLPRLELGVSYSLK